MSGTITRIINRDSFGEEDRFLAVNPNGKVVNVFQAADDYDDDNEGMVKLYERGGFEEIQCCDFSPMKPGVVGVGDTQGNVHIFDTTVAYEPGNDDTLRLNTKDPRACYSLSFNDIGYALAAFDKSRQDLSVKVYDIHSNSRHKPIVEYIPNEVIVSAKFISEKSEPFVFLAGSHKKLLREFDTRVSKHTFQLGTKCTYNINTDYDNPFIFSSSNEEGSLTFWDRRKLTQAQSVNSSGVINESPVLLLPNFLNNYRNENNGNAPCKISSLIKGEIAALYINYQQEDSVSIQRCQITSIPSLKSEINQYETLMNRNKAENPSFQNKVSGPSDYLFVSKSMNHATKYESTIAFDYCRNMNIPFGTDFVCMRKSGSVYRMPAIESQTDIVFNSYNDITFCGPFGAYYRRTDNIFDDFNNLIINYNEDINDNNKGINSDINKKIPNDAIGNQVLRKQNSGLDFKESTARRSSHHQLEMHSVHENFIREDDLNKRDEKDSNSDTSDTSSIDSCFGDSFLENDICVTIRRRALLGYSTNANLNMKISKTSSTFQTSLQLTNTWKWLSITHDLVAAGKMTADGFDFGYLGVAGIWNLDKQVLDANRYSGKNGYMPTELIAAAKKISERRSAEIKRLATPAIGHGIHSKKETQRKLCMYFIGWDFGTEALELKYKKLIDDNQIERAVGWAVFHGDIDRAINILGDSKQERFKIMSTAVAGYKAYEANNAKNNNGYLSDDEDEKNNPWKEHCRSLASFLENPYLRFLFAFIADRNWSEIFDEPSIPLREKIGVALRFLPDDKLDNYFEHIASEVIKQGEIEGLILTGLTKGGIDLLQSYVDKKSDIQSACLISAFACPKYFNDPRVEEWTECYRSLLNSWNLFGIRAKFDVSRTKLSKGISGVIKTKPLPRQVYLQCTKCHKNISRIEEKMRNKFSKPKSSCPHCGFPLPRCSICLLTLGDPVPKEDIKFSEFNNSDRGNDYFETQFKEWFSFCLTCNHGMHAGHGEEWFSKHYVCPVPDCNCKCNNI
ncbi:hypothetical protein B5S29_g1076 [[Candida] boidinii]|nr:hypothetical protein B5S29_g1076 [[Candida] boidinii]